MLKRSIILSLLLASTPVQATELVFQFKNPSFSGVNTGAQWLTIENQETTRRAQLQKDIQAGLDKLKADQSNTNISKFMNNLESRIYAQISQNLATAMFANGGANNSGTLNFEGNTNSKSVPFKLLSNSFNSKFTIFI